jgi:3-methyladenine DNA glycosylase Tag
MLTRCAWCGTDPLYVAYHDEEWGVPVYDDQKLFEMLILEGAQTAESQAMSRDLLRRGFKFVAPTICYAFMQAVGMVNDHIVDCFRYEAVKR